jgi:hypothetical protein
VAANPSGTGEPGSLPPNRTPLPSPLPISPSVDPTKTGGAGAETTLTGTLEQGVEAHCLILRAADSTTWQLIGGDQSVLRVGAKVVVKGRPNPQLMSYCMQGTIFEVTEARTA